MGVSATSSSTDIEYTTVWRRCCVTVHKWWRLGLYYRRREQEDKLQAERTSRLELMHKVEEFRQRIRNLEVSEVSKRTVSGFGSNVAA